MWWEKSNFNGREIRTMANAVRLLALDSIQAANSGHPGVALGFADVMTTLVANHLRFDPSVGDWSDRDRLIMSAGHGSALLYATLYLAGYPIEREQLRAFRKIGGLPGHPERNLKIGVEMTTGPLGQGFASAVGIAMARPDNYVYVIASDGDLMEGVSMESASFAGFHKLKNLIVLWDNNGITIDGLAATVDNIPEKFRAMGWATIELDGMKPREIDSALRIAKGMHGPVLLACKTIIGFGSADAGTEKVHGTPLDYHEAMRMMSELSPEYERAVPLWEKLVMTKRDASHKPGSLQSLEWFDLPSISDRDYSTRELFNIVIKQVATRNPNLVIGGSADLTHSTGAFADAENYIHYGVREHAMGAIMNGLALAGFYPYGSTFLIFSDYMRPAIRMAALMGLPTLFVFSHDSIAIGEDGPTHQPVEQLPSLRLIPNFTVYRPCNLTEMFLCLKSHFDRGEPSAIVLTRQKFATVPDVDNANLSGYLVSGEKNSRVKIIASGSEVALAIAIRDKLESQNIRTSVMSVPSLEIMMQKNRDGLAEFISGGFSVWIEASAQIPAFSTSMIVRTTNFGRSGNGKDVYEKYGFDAGYIASEIIKKLKKI